MAKRYGGKRNALKHGAYVREILPGERLEEFKALHRGLIKEWKPSGTLEEQTVMSLARAVWCKDRVNRFYYDEAYWVQEPEEDELNHVHGLANLLESASTIEMAGSIISVLPELYREFMSDELAQTKNGDVRDIPKLGEKLHDFLINREEFVIIDRQSYKKRFEKARHLEIVDHTDKDQ